MLYFPHSIKTSNNLSNPPFFQLPNIQEIVFSFASVLPIYFFSFSFENVEAPDIVQESKEKTIIYLMFL